MTVGQLIQLLQGFPPQFPVFFSPDDEGRIAMEPRDVVMNLVDPKQSVVIEDRESREVPEGFIDSVVVYPRNVS